MRIVFYVMSCLIIFFGISFAMLNSGKVFIHYYVGSREVSLSILLVLTLGIGFLLGTLASFFSWLRLKKDNISLKHQLKLTKNT